MTLKTFFKVRRNMRQKGLNMAITAKVRFETSQHLIPEICKDCKGKHWNDDSSTRQNKIIDAYGKLPNPCVSGEGNGMFPEVKCPYHRKNHI